VNILTIHYGHNGSFSASADNKLLFHCEYERFSKRKYKEDLPSSIVDSINQLNIKFDIIVFSTLEGLMVNKKLILNYLKTINKKQKCNIFIETCYHDHHHLYHAYCASYHYENFDKIIVADGCGSFNPLEGEEVLSIYDNEYNKLLSKKINTLNQDFVSFGSVYDVLNKALGLHILEGGKTMAYSTYGRFDNKIKERLNNFNFDLFNLFLDAKKLHPNLKIDAKDTFSLNYVHTVQKCLEDRMLNLFNTYFNKKEKILCSGGFFQNILVNTVLKDNGFNIEVDPMCSDHGISLGMLYHLNKKNLKRENNIYLSFVPEYDMSLFNNYNIKLTSLKEVCEILLNNPVALFQGRSEQGQRGLGNRSLLINPTHENCVHKINSIKKREWYRPFAASILEEDTSTWFDTKNIKTSPYMLYVLKCLSDKKKHLQFVLSNQETCRIQTVNKDFNTNYYNLIKEFKKISGFPFILNTSLNLPGQVIVETLEDLKYTFEHSDLKYIYLPNINTLVSK
jgi:carbamoyltransferase